LLTVDSTSGKGTLVFLFFFRDRETKDLLLQSPNFLSMQGFCPPPFFFESPAKYAFSVMFLVGVFLY